MTGDDSVAGLLWHPSRRQVVQGALSILLAIVLVVWLLPLMAGTTWSAVLLTLSHIAFGSVLTLFGLLCLGLWSYTFTLTGSLPGLRHVQALSEPVRVLRRRLRARGGAAGVAVSSAAFRS